MILISILDDQDSSIIPVSYEFKEKLDKHIIIYDPKKCDKGNIERIIKAQKEHFFRNDGSKPEILEIEVDENSYESMLDGFESIKEETENMEYVYLNPSGRLHSIAIVLTPKLLETGAKVIAYDRYSNSYNLHTSTGVTYHTIKNSIRDIRIHLNLKGYTVLDYCQKRELESRKESILSLTKNLTGFKTFSEQLQRKKPEDIEGFDSYKQKLQSIGKLNDKGFVQGKVFEEYIYHLLCDNFNFDDVMTGVLIEVGDGVRNELDILMLKDNHLHTIECKLVNGLDGEHFVYKTDLVSEYLDDDGKAMILSIGSPNLRTTKSGKKRIQFTHGDRARANHSDIMIHQSEHFDVEAFLDDVREWFCT